MLDETIDIPEPTETEDIKDKELQVMADLLNAIAEVAPQERNVPKHINCTSLRSQLRNPDAARGWFFEELVMSGVRRFARGVNRRDTDFIDTNPIRRGVHNGIHFRYIGGALYALEKDERGHLKQTAEYDGLIRVGNRLVIIETKVTKHVPKKRDLNMEGKIGALRTAFPDIPISMIVIMQPEVQEQTAVEHVTRPYGNFTLLTRKGGDMRKTIEDFGARIHVLAMGGGQLVPA